MPVDKKEKTLFFAAVLNVLILSIGFYFMISPLIYLSLLGFLTIVLIAPESIVLHLLFFYLPWNGLLKINLESNSFFTFAVVLLIFKFIILKYRFNKKFSQIILLLFLYSIVVKVLNYDSFNARYFVFFIYLIFLIYFISNSDVFFNNLLTLLFLFSLGTLLANISGDFLTKLPHMYGLNKAAESQLETSWGIYRNNAFAGDPNRNSTQILVAILSLLIIEIKKPLIKYVMILSLTFYGMLTVSKMFYLVIVIIFLLYLGIRLINKERILYKLTFFIILITLGYYVLAFGIVDNQIDNIMQRVTQTEGASGFDSGRSSLREGYYSYLSDNWDTLLFGKGLLTNFKPVRNVAHNTLIQMLFGLGVIGSGIFVLLIFNMIYFFKTNIRNLSNILYFFSLILILGISFNALDFLNMDAFFFYILIVILIKIYLSQKEIRLISVN